MASMTYRYSTYWVKRALTKLRKLTRTSNRPTAATVAGGVQSTTVPSFIGGHKLKLALLADRADQRSAFEMVRTSGDSKRDSGIDLDDKLCQIQCPETPVIRAVDFYSSSEYTSSFEALDLDASSEPETPRLRPVDSPHDLAEVSYLDLHAPSAVAEAWWAGLDETRRDERMEIPSTM